MKTGILVLILFGAFQAKAEWQAFSAEAKIGFSKAGQVDPKAIGNMISDLPVTCVKRFKNAKGSLVNRESLVIRTANPSWARVDKRLVSVEGYDLSNMDNQTAYAEGFYYRKANDGDEVHYVKFVVLGQSEQDIYQGIIVQERNSGRNPGDVVKVSIGMDDSMITALQTGEDPKPFNHKYSDKVVGQFSDCTAYGDND